MWAAAVTAVLLLGALLRRSRRRRAEPAVRIHPSATFEEVAAAYSAFLREDARVSPTARRLARGIAPYARRTATHFGTLPELAPPPSERDAPPFDARAALKIARGLTGERGAEARAAVNHSVFLWNQLFPCDGSGNQDDAGSR